MHVCSHCKVDIKHNVPIKTTEGTFCSWVCYNAAFVQRLYEFTLEGQKKA